MKVPSILVYLAAALIFAVSCSTSPPPSEPRASIELVDAKGAGSGFAVRAESNPYVPFSGIIQKPQEEFVLLAIDLELPGASQVEVALRLRGPGDEDLGTLWDASRLTDYWTARELNEDRLKARIAALERSCLPGARFQAKAGRSRVIAVLSCPVGFSRPATLAAEVFVNGSLAEEMTTVLPKK